MAACETPSRDEAMIRFGAQLGMHPPAEQFALVRRLEALGFDSVWVGDHVAFHNPLYESLTLLAAYAWFVGTGLLT